MDDTKKPDPLDDESVRQRDKGLRNIAKRLFREDVRSDAYEALSAMLETGDKAKTEVVRMVAREVRNYLDELKIKEDLQELLTNHALEVRASFHLRPLSEDQKRPRTDPQDEATARVGRKPDDAQG